MDKLNLIIPVAADKEEYEHVMPYLFNFSVDGTLLCIKSIQGLDLNRFDHIYLTILKKHDKQYYLRELVEMQLKRLHLENAKVVVLSEATTSQAETVYQTIHQENIEGSIFVKDADGYFNCDFTLGNGIAIYPLDKLPLVDPRNKSYVNVDDQFYITNIIEKKIISRFFNAGAYLFDSADEFCIYYERLKDCPSLYMSHIVFAMLLDQKSFRPIQVSNYKDWGNMEMYNISGL